MVKGIDLMKNKCTPWTRAIATRKEKHHENEK
jgi:hypothetical protein